MKIIVISDSHGNITNLKHVMGFAKKIGAKAVIHCGDWNDVKSVKTVLSFGMPLYSVFGNADISPEVETILLSKCKKFDRLFLEVELGGKRVGIVHNIKQLTSNIKLLDILFFGHWQRQEDTSWQGIRAINPGALENDVNFVVYDTASGKIEFVNEQS